MPQTPNQGLQNPKGQVVFDPGVMSARVAAQNRIDNARVLRDSTEAATAAAIQMTEGVASSIARKISQATAPLKAVSEHLLHFQPMKVTLPPNNLPIVHTPVASPPPVDFTQILTNADIASEKTQKNVVASLDDITLQSKELSDTIKKDVSKHLFSLYDLLDTLQGYVKTADSGRTRADQDNTDILKTSIEDANGVHVLEDILKDVHDETVQSRELNHHILDLTDRVTHLVQLTSDQIMIDLRSQRNLERNFRTKDLEEIRKQGTLFTSNTPRTISEGMKAIMEASYDRTIEAINQLWDGARLAKPLRSAMAEMSTKTLDITLWSIENVFKILPKVAGFFLGSTKLLSTIALIAGGSFAATMAADPEKLQKYIETFSYIWSDLLVPTFRYIVDQVLLPLGAEFERAGKEFYDWYTSEGKATIIVIGDFVDTILHYVLGTAVPATLTAIGHLLKFFAEGFAEVYKAISGLFGGGEYGGDGIFKNIVRMIDQVIKFVVFSIDEVLTWVFRMIGLDTLLGFNDGETIAQRIDRVFIEMWKAFEDAHGRITAATWEFIYSLDDKFFAAIDYVKDAMWSMVDGIKNKIVAWFDGMVAMIPSWQDIEKLFKQSMLMMPMPNFMREWLMGEMAAAPVPLPRAPLPPEMRQPLMTPRPDPRYDQMSRMPTNIQMPLNYIDQSVHQNTSNSVSGGGGGGESRPRGRPSTRPEVSGFDARLYGGPR